MKTVNIGGVPEHFNLAWYLALKKGAFKNEGINLRWNDYFGGTGEMTKALRTGEIDLAVILTEGIIQDIIAGNPSKIVQSFVKSPLIWGIHVAHNSKYQTLDELRGKKAAISRFGSGSHLMSFVNAQNHSWDLKKDLNFEIVKSLDGAVEELTAGKADYFLWEKFTTKPLVDNHTFRKLGECPTPWPCFVIAARTSFLKNEKDALEAILKIINSVTSRFKDIPDIDKTVAERYNQKIEDVQDWLNLTEWSQEKISKKTIENIQNKLFELHIIPEIWDYNILVSK